MERPQDLYPQVGDLAKSVELTLGVIEHIRSQAARWDTNSLRVDEGSTWTATETHTALLEDLAAATTALHTAAGHCEGAWAAIGRLASD